MCHKGCVVKGLVTFEFLEVESCIDLLEFLLINIILMDNLIGWVR